MEAKIKIIKGLSIQDGSKMLWISKETQHIFLEEDDIEALRKVIDTWDKRDIYRQQKESRTRRRLLALRQLVEGYNTGYGSIKVIDTGEYFVVRTHNGGFSENEELDRMMKREMAPVIDRHPTTFYEFKKTLLAVNAIPILKFLEMNSEKGEIKYNEDWKDD